MLSIVLPDTRTSVQGSTENADLSGLLLGIRRPGKLMPAAKWSREVRTREDRKRILAAGERVGGKSYRQVEGGKEGAAWSLGLPDSPVFPATLANYDWRRFDQPQAGVARNKKITVETNFKNFWVIWCTLSVTFLDQQQCFHEKFDQHCCWIRSPPKRSEA